MGSCFCDALGAGLTVLLLAAFPVVQITLGAVYLRECPAAPLVPVNVMALGIWALLMSAMFFLPRLLCPGSPRPNIWTVCIVTLLLFFFTWFFLSSYQIYSIFPPDYDRNTTASTSSPDSILNTLDNQNQNQNPSRALGEMIQSLVLLNRTSTEEPSKPQRHVESYCNRTIYMFAFWTYTLFYVLAGGAVLMIICLCFLMKCSEIVVPHLTT
ncbi:uncharacterized protein LOC108250887 [Kryptolebias marmoratus]|uniref:uncharacterized protein LOC108250887 n=1 Tax=Kryptolebias marmoratus TaxID=37003 RepID=UPI0007F8FE68|nr:uncharacterized protein LOC108250887 [Kryptolebias marmoratus]